MWHSSWAGPCFSMTLQNCPGLGGFCRGWAAPFLFFGSDWYSSTEAFCSSHVQMLWACHCLFSFFSPLLCLFLLLPLSLSSLCFLLSPCHSIFCLTYCLTAGMLSTVSLSQLLAVAFISLKQESPFSFHFALCNLSPPVFFFFFWV